MRNHIVAIAYPEPEEVEKFCSLREITGTFAQKIKHPDFIQAVESDLARLAKEANYNSLEKVKGNFALVDKEFEVGVVLTPTMKIKRKAARDLYVNEIAKIYEAADAAIAVKR